MSGHLLELPAISLRARAFVAAALSVLSGTTDLTARTENAFTLHPQFSARVAYDDNVFLQDFAPNPAIANAAPSKRATLVGYIGAKIVATWKPSAATEICATYAPEIARFRDAATEDHTVHALQLALTEQIADTKFTLQASANAVDGSDISPIYGCAGGAPALGAPVVRDRRDALLVRAAARLQVPTAWGFIRPLATRYAHDFQTAQRVHTGYMNYIDRAETLAGIDCGVRFAPSLHAIAGFRYGRQEQRRLHGVDSPYDSIVRRFVVGLEGTWGKTLRLQALGGPELRSYPATVSPLFDAAERPLWIDASLSWTVSARHSGGLVYRRQQLPSSASLGMYDDSCFEANWRAQLTPRWSTVAALKLLRGDWVTPNAREDRLLVPSLAVRFANNARAEAEIGWTADYGYNRLPGKTDRDYRRNVFSAALNFKL